MKLRRLISLGVAGCIAAMLGGCGTTDDNHGLDPNDPTTITVWHYYNGVQQENFDNMVLEFNETLGHELGIVVEAHGKGTVNDLAESALASLRGGIGAEAVPNMFAAYAETAYIAEQMGFTVDLSKYFTEGELSEYVEGYLDEGFFTSDGALNIFPTAKSTEVMMLNVTDWEKFASAAGVTVDDLSTWEGLAKTAEKYYDYTDALTPDIPNDGRAFFGRDSIANYMIVGAKQLGLEYFTANENEFVMNEDKEAVRRLWDCYYAPYVKGHYFSQSRFRSDDAKIGAIIAMVCSTTGAAYFPDSVTLNDSYTYPIEGLVLPVPNFEGTEKYLVQQGAGMVVVKSDEKTEYACSVFLKFLTEKERNINFSVSSGYLPVKKSSNDITAIAKAFEEAGYPETDIMLKTMETAASEINSYNMFAAKPFEKSSSARDFLDSFIQTTAQKARGEIAARIAAGEDRNAVIAEYVSDTAFDLWYNDFIFGLKTAVGI
ncbi:MAG: extracellular solute-binding protein [Oscillospiraceae bacterium]|nr:extracellular solute-binding protein [Oscillospiraceae bacterium]